jgi:DNA-binding PadR family transcriptional regulator
VPGRCPADGLTRKAVGGRTEILAIGLEFHARRRILGYEYLEASMGDETVAKRRKVGNLLALSLLSLLAQKPMYPYEMAQTLRARGKDQNFKVNWGSLYTVVRNLEKYGFIEAAVTDREGRQPERTTYQITGDGLAELRDWLTELLSMPEDERGGFVVALSEAGILPPNEVIGLLTARLATLDKANASQRADLQLWTERLPRVLLVETAGCSVSLSPGRSAGWTPGGTYTRPARCRPSSWNSTSSLRGGGRRTRKAIKERPRPAVLQHREPRPQPHHQSAGNPQAAAMRPNHECTPGDSPWD